GARRRSFRPHGGGGAAPTKAGAHTPICRSPDPGAIGLRRQPWVAYAVSTAARVARQSRRGRRSYKKRCSFPRSVEVPTSGRLAREARPGQAQKPALPPPDPEIGKPGPLHKIRV